MKVSMHSPRFWPHDFLAKSRAAMYVESIHFPGRFEYECGDCGKRLSTKQALMGHRTYHNQERILAKIRSQEDNRVLSTYFAS